MNYKTSAASQPAEFLQPVLAIATQASAEIIKIYNTDFAVTGKEDASPLTRADIASHEVITRGLHKLTPDLPVLSEESAALPFSRRKTWETYWLIDPLDGTREFIKRNGEFTVNIALIDGNKPVLGIVHVPVTGVCYYASKHSGAFKAGPGAAPQPLQTRSTKTGKFVAAGSRSHSNERTAEFFKLLGTNTEVISAGSALKFCLVAEGKVDIYPRFGPTSEWDTAAAQCLVEEAGGIVTDTNFNPLLYNVKESLLNPEFLVIADPSFDWRPYLPN